jgi:diaminopimelate epimerase
MGTPFVKMHGAGNDFAILDARQQPIAMPAARARRLADRHRGIGCDQLILLEPSSRADLFMRIFNPDGSEAEACGNATRCVAALVGGAPLIETRGGLLRTLPGGEMPAIDMGVPRFGWEEIPLAMPMDTRDMPVAWGPLARPAAVSVGNPHIVFFVPDAAAVPLRELGPEIETDPLFPARVNVNVAAVEAPDRIQLRVWERGAGLTLACGSGACATFAAARRRKLVDARVSVALPGGTLAIGEGEGGRLLMSGPVETSFRGETEL